MHEKGSREERKNIIFVKLGSLSDLARYACMFDSSAAETFYEGKESKLFSFGEHVGNTLIAYYVEAKKRAETIRYAYAMPDSSESAELANYIDVQQFHTYYINIIGMDLQKFHRARGLEQKDMDCIRIDRTEDLTKAVLKKAIENEMIGHAYVFTYKGNTVIGAFDIVDALIDDKRAFYYVVAKESETNAKNACFIRYNYSANSHEFTNEFGEHSYMYIKLIHLAEPFPGMVLDMPE